MQRYVKSIADLNCVVYRGDDFRVRQYGHFRSVCGGVDPELAALVRKVTALLLMLFEYIIEEGTVEQVELVLDVDGLAVFLWHRKPVLVELAEALFHLLVRRAFDNVVVQRILFHLQGAARRTQRHIEMRLLDGKFLLLDGHCFGFFQGLTLLLLDNRGC